MHGCVVLQLVVPPVASAGSEWQRMTGGRGGELGSSGESAGRKVHVFSGLLCPSLLSAHVSKGRAHMVPTGWLAALQSAFRRRGGRPIPDKSTPEAHSHFSACGARLAALARACCAARPWARCSVFDLRSTALASRHPQIPWRRFVPGLPPNTSSAQAVSNGQTSSRPTGAASTVGTCRNFPPGMLRCTCKRAAP
jgi:hypothetical protein